jgi:hypothetical protein
MAADKKPIIKHPKLFMSIVSEKGRLSSLTRATQYKQFELKILMTQTK